MGYSIIWIDTENAFDKETAERFNIDTSKMIYAPLGNVNEVTTYISNLLDIFKENLKNKVENPKIMIVLDSLGNLTSDKEHNDSISGDVKVDMTRAKDVKKFFRVITKDIGILKIPMIVS